MTETLQRDNIVSSHRKSQAEMIDEQINELCEQTGLIKKRLLGVANIYPSKWADRIKYTRGLTPAEKEKIQCWISQRAAELESFQLDGDIAEAIDLLHSRYAIFKGRLLKPLSTHYHVLERGSEIPEENKDRLISEIRKIAKVLKSFSFEASNEPS